MTRNNPFTARIQQAAQEGYVTPTRRAADVNAPVADAYRTGAVRSPFEAPTLEPTATPKQVALIHQLFDERDLSVETRPAWRDRLFGLARNANAVRNLDRQAASNLITYLFGLPMNCGTTFEPEAFKAVPAGHYALEQDGDITFVRVDRPQEGKWAGKVFVSLQHGDDYSNMSRAAGFTMLGRILDQGVLECSTRYGRSIGRCGVCHRTLTNAESRAAGIGPKCRENL